jgi:hypothetical protein
VATRNINQLYQFYRYIIRKQRGVFITIPQFNANMDAGQMDAVAEWFEPYGVTQKLHDALRQIRVYYQFTSDAAGMVTFPNDYIHILGSPFTVTGSSVNEVVFVQESELPFALKSQLRPVTNSYPIAVDTSTGFSIYPQQTQIGFFNYLKRPATPNLAYTQVGRDITYDAGASTQLEFSDIYVNNILAKALVYAGVNMDEQGIVAFAQQYNQETK